MSLGHKYPPANPVPGLCPCCLNPQNSTFLQSIHNHELFEMVQKLANLLGNGPVARKNIFCYNCIAWAKAERSKLQLQLKPTVASEAPAPSQQHVALQSVVHSRPHYSPVSDPEASHSVPESFSAQLYQSQECRIGARLANPHDSPIHSAIIPYFLSTGSSRPIELPLMNANQPAQLFSAPLPSPLADENAQLWNMDSHTVGDAGDQGHHQGGHDYHQGGQSHHQDDQDGDQGEIGPRERVDQPE